ncbi:HTH-type transcriptional regulator DmlR [mine drainage metagenome]|uniref:HTH-type transcriptional regulator DmlR n=1 Tax=mine drainage metagenome TaxID=410659 RepID=A0A1J5PTE0_9ZZZZ
MSKLKQLETFVTVALRGGLTAAARAEGVAPAMVGRRMDALEQRLGVKLLLRSTRRVSLTQEGAVFLEDCQRLLSELADAEASLSAGGIKASGCLNLSAPAGFGRHHVAPLVPLFCELHPEVTVCLDLSDRVHDLTTEGFDCAVRIGEMPDSSLVSVRLAENRRVCVAAPAYLKRHGTPQRPQDLLHFDCLTLSGSTSQSRGWAFSAPPGDPAEAMYIKPGGRLSCSDGEVLFDWCLRGYGIAWRSTWEVQARIDSGQLVTVLQDFAAPGSGIYVVFAQRKLMPLRLRLWIDYLKQQYAQAGFGHE